VAETASLLNTLKQLLKTNGKTYQDVAEALFLSEASVKQMFASNRITLERLDRICNELLQIEISDLVTQMQNQQSSITELSEDQERKVVADFNLFVVAISIMNSWTPSEIVEHFEIDMDECRRHLASLESLQLIQVRPGNQIRLQIDRNFKWRPDGPIQRYFRQHIQGDFLDSRFDNPGEKLVFLTGMLSDKSVGELLKRIERLATEFLELNRDDSRLELQHRHGGSLLVGYRPWQMAGFAELRRTKNPEAPEG